MNNDYVVVSKVDFLVYTSGKSWSERWYWKWPYYAVDQDENEKSVKMIKDVTAEIWQLLTFLTETNITLLIEPEIEASLQMLPKNLMMIKHINIECIEAGEATTESFISKVKEVIFQLDKENGT